MKKNKNKKLLLATSVVIAASAVAGITFNSQEDVEASTVSLSDYVKNLYPGDIITIEGKEYHYINTTSQGIKIIDKERIEKAFDTGGKNEFNPSRSANVAYYLNRTYYNSLSTKFKSMMVQNATWNIGDEFNEAGKTVTANVGLLSFWEFEYSLPKSSYSVTGAKLPYFTDGFEWSLTPSSRLAGNAWPVHPGYGNIDYNLETTRAEWIRPAVILKADTPIDNLNGTVITNQVPRIKSTIPSQTISAKGKTTTVSLGSYFEDVDGDKLTYTAVSNSTINVTTSISSTGTLTLTGQSKGGTYVIVTAKDPSGLSVSQQFYVTVNNTPPAKKTTISSQTISGVGKTKDLTLSTYFSDADGDSMSYKVTNTTGNVSGSVSNGVLTLRGNQKGTDSITVTAMDSSGDTVSQTFTTTVSNSAPTNTSTIPAQIIANKGVTTTVNLSNYFQDIDGDTITYTVSSNATSRVTGTVSGSTLTLTGVAKGPATITVTAKDSSGASVTQTFTATVNNQAPTIKTIIPEQSILKKGSATTVNLSSYFQDADNDSLTYTVTSNATDKVTGSVSGSTLKLTGQSKGSASITVIATDTSGESIIQTFITNVGNSAPNNKSTIPAQTIATKGLTTTVDLSSYFQDADNDSLTYTVTSNATDKVTGSVSGSILTLIGQSKGSVSITVTATDTSGETTTQSFTTTVGNASPTALTISSQEMTKIGEQLTFNLNDYFQDIDDDNLTYTVTSSATDKVTSAVNGSMLTLTSVSKGVSIINVTVVDGSGGLVNQNFTVTVNAQAPINTNIIESQVINGAGNLKQLNLSNYFEDELGSLTYEVTSSVTNKVSTTLNGDTLTLTGISKGNSNITVTAINSLGESTTQNFTTTVSNTSPTLTTNFNKLNLRPGEVSSVIVLTGIDPDNDSLSYVVTSSNDEIAKVTLVGNQLILEGLQDGSANVTVKVIDGDVDYGQTSSTKTFTVDVGQPAPVAPQEPIDVDNTGGLTNGTVNLGDIFDDENPADLIFKPNVLVNEPEADIYIANQNLVIENPKNDGLISVEVEATNIYGKTAVATLNMLIEVDNTNQNESKDGKANLKLMQGEFTLNTSDLTSFGTVKLTASKQTVTSNFAQNFGVVDARGTQEGWNVTVSATPFTVETFDDFVGVPHQLPAGSLALKDVTAIERINHINKTDGLPTSAMTGLSAIDTNNALNVLNANVGEGLGEFQFNFGENALALTLDALTAKIDTVNYPDKNTPYVSTVTWDLISGPQM